MCFHSSKLAFFPKEFGEKQELISLPHPRNSKPNDFVVLEGKIYEIQLVDRYYCSFFFDNHAIADGSALFAHEIHPLFLGIPLLFERKQNFHPKHSFFDNSPLKQVAYMIIPYFNLVCTEKYQDEIDHVKLNQELLVNWLINRCKKLIPIVTKKYQVKDDEAIELSWGIIRHYIPIEIQKIMIDEIKHIEIEKQSEVKIENTPPPTSNKTKRGRKPKADTIPRPRGCADIASFFK